jgi:protein-disulfide isomerase
MATTGKSEDRSEVMTRAILLGAAGAVVSVAVLAGGFAAGRATPALATDMPQSTAQAAGEQLSRKDVENIVREYLLANPELLVEVQKALDAKQKEEQRIAQLGVIKDNRDKIFTSPNDGIFGNPNGTTTVVEFFDYNCHFCKRAIEDMKAVTAADPNVRFVLKEFPILGPDSQKASVVSMAFHKMMPEKYGEFHTQLLGGEGRADEAKAIRIAVSLGADEAKLREGMKDLSINQIFDQTYDLANKLSITGTPSYVIGNEVVFGAQGLEVLDQKLAEAKAACASSAC